jgi:hypothetical protein
MPNAKTIVVTTAHYKDVTMVPLTGPSRDQLIHAALSPYGPMLN